MAKNSGASFEEEVYELIFQVVQENRFMVSFPNVRIRRKPRYYSRDRDAEIEFDISVEKYLGNPDENKNTRPSIIVIIKCKDYSSSIPNDDVEEFHAKLQQVGADKTKGMMITQNGCFQRSALTYAESKGIALAIILQSKQVCYMLPLKLSHFLLKEEMMEEEMTEEEKRKIIEKEERERIERRIAPLIEKSYVSNHVSFYSLTGNYSLEELLFRFFSIDYLEMK